MVKRKAEEIENGMDVDSAGEASGGSPAKKEKIQKDRVNTTVFISSLPYETTTTDLITHFSFVGPVKNGFVVKDTASGQSKGVGYITFTLKEDADKAVEELNNGPFGGAGRKIRVEWAGDKPTRLVRSQAAAAAASSDQPAPARTKPIQPGYKTISSTITSDSPIPTQHAPVRTADSNAIRTVILMGIPSEVDKNTLWKKVRKYDGVENGKDGLVYPVVAGGAEAEGVVQEKMGQTAHILFSSHAKALEGVKKLHNHTYKGVLLSCVLKKRVDTSNVKAKAGGQAEGANRAGRLIIRNLAWNVTESDLRTLFLPYGPILGITLPTLPSTKAVDPSKPAPPPKARGFAFVWFLAKADAEKAIEGRNGEELKERKMAVDWALSKEKWQEVKAAEPEPEVKPEVEADGEEGDLAEVDGDVTMGDGEASTAEDEADNDDAESATTAADEKPVKPTLPDVEEGSTLFIRNLPFETTEEELRNLFRAFGPLRYAKITLDRATGRSRGTGFACFWKTEDANKVLAEAGRVKEITGANSISITPSNPFALPSILTIDPSASAAASLVIHGRTLDVVRALTREDAAVRKDDAERQRLKGDKRNTYLMREGVIFPNTPAARTLPELELEKRVSSFKARRTLLESNPSLYISKTRLSVRQLPLFATDRTLKRLAIHAVREFDNEVAAGDREPLSREEAMDETLSPALEARKNAKGSKGGKGKKERDTVVIQSKVTRQADRVDPLTNLGKSKGYGFLEVRSHREALKVLRWANNNPEVGPIMKTWYGEEMAELEARTKERLDEIRKAEGKQKEADEMELMYKKLQMKVKDGISALVDGTRQGKTLLVEFSVENVQVVKRRVEKTVIDKMAGPSGHEKRKRAEEMEAADSENESGPTPATAVGKPDAKGKSKGKGKDHVRKPKREGSETTAAPTSAVGERPAKRRKAEGERKTGPKPDAAGGQQRVAGKKEGGSEKKGEEGGEKKLGMSMGGLIGRKRKERKGK